MEISVGAYKQIESCAFPLKRAESAWLKIPVPQKGVLKLKVSIVEKGEKSQYRLYGEGDYGVLEISDFQDSLGGGVGAPTQLAKHADTQVYFTFSASSAGEISFLQFQFWIDQ